MGGSGKNGNQVKGNSVKKGRRKVDPCVDFVDGDLYGKVYKLLGEDHISIELAAPDPEGDTIVKARISGKMYKKVWFRPDNFVVLGGKFSDKIYDLKGMVKKSDESKVRKLFEKEGVDDMRVLVGDDIDDADEDVDDTFFGVQKTKSIKKTNPSDDDTPSTMKVNVKAEITKPEPDESSESDSSVDIDDL